MSETMKYKGFYGTAEYSAKDHVFWGKVLNINGLILYEGATVDKLESDFRGAIDEYLEECEAAGVEPQKPASGTFNVRVGAKLHGELVVEASRKGESLNALVKDILDKYFSKQLA